jgi:hypothetical protein
MEFIHERLERLIEYFDKSNNQAERLFVLDFDSYKRMFVHETMNIRTYLNRKSLPIKNEKSFETLIHQYQSLIAFWLDKLYHEHTKTAAYPKEVVEMVTEEFEKLLSFMHDRYEKYFNLDEKIPEISIRKIREKLKPRIQKLRTHLGNECTDEALKGLALSPLIDLLDGQLKKKVTYRYLFYTRRVEKALATFSNARYTTRNCTGKAMIELMIMMNYNTLEVISFITNKMVSDIDILLSVEEKKDRLRFFLKELNQCKERTDIAFKPLSPSLKEQIARWICEEIIYLDNGSQPAGHNGKQPVTNDEKIQLSTPVEVISLIARAAKDNKVITNRYNTEVFKNLSKHVSTKQAETLSVNSMIKKSYVAERRTKEAAIDVLHGLIKRIHEY